jgi:endonuclease YncB( thermonuclease family)
MPDLVWASTKTAHLGDARGANDATNLPSCLRASSISSSLLLTLADEASNQPNLPTNGEAPTQTLQDSLETRTPQWTSDVVVRVLDANTVKLKRSGLVSLAAVQTPNYTSLPECFNVAPSAKLKQILPPKTRVLVTIVQMNSNSVPRALIAFVNDQANMRLVNTELVAAGAAKTSARGQKEAEAIVPGIAIRLKQLQSEAKMKGIGLFQTCQAQSEFPQDDQFEPLELTVETQFFPDGGKQVLRARQVDAGKRETPVNPGDSKSCSDFGTYEEALQWYEYYKPWYGDVAKLDSNGDGVPCNGLPHTSNPERYRLKKATIQPN